MPSPRIHIGARIHSNFLKCPEKVGKPQGVKEISELAEQQIFVSPEVTFALYCAEAQAPG